MYIKSSFYYVCVCVYVPRKINSFIVKNILFYVNFLNNKQLQSNKNVIKLYRVFEKKIISSLI